MINEDAYMKNKELDTIKSKLTISDYEADKFKSESESHQLMINMLSENKEKEIIELNKFYNETVQSHSNLLNNVETDQKIMIEN